MRLPFFLAFLALSAGTGQAGQVPAGLQGKWQADFEGSEVKAGEQPMVEVKADGSLSGSTGCNRYSGGLMANGNLLTLSPLRLTRMACDEPAMTLERRFLSILKGELVWQPAFAGTGGRLLQQGKVVMVLKPAAEPVEITVPVPGGAKVERLAVTYDCGTRDLLVNYVSAGTTALATLQVGDEVVLAAHVLSASGSRYMGGAYSWWVKGEEAVLEDQRLSGRDAALTCRVRKT